MKKIIVSMLSVAALSLMVMSDMNARARGGRRKRAMSVPMTQKEKARVIVEDTKAMMAPVPKDEKREAAEALLATLQQNQEEFQLAQLYIKHKQIMNKIAAKKEEQKNLNVGFFDFSNADYIKTKNELALLNDELREVKAQIAAQEKMVGRPASNAIKYAVGGLIVSVGLVALDRYFEVGVTDWVMTKGQAGYDIARGYGSAAWQKAGELGTKVRSYLPSYFQPTAPAGTPVPAAGAPVPPVGSAAADAAADAAAGAATLNTP